MHEIVLGFLELNQQELEDGTPTEIKSRISSSELASNIVALQYSPIILIL